MFHNSTTIHRLNSKPALMGGENRMVNYSFGEFKVDWLKFKYGASSVGKVLKASTWVFGGPILWEGAKLGWRGAKYVGRRVEFAGKTAWEATKGVKDATLKPVYTLMSSVAQDVKQTLLRDTPKAAVQASYKTPIGILKSPWNAVLGVRDSVKGLLHHSWEGIKDLATLKPVRRVFELLGSGREIVKDTRQLITDTFKRGGSFVNDTVIKPAGRTLKPIFSPIFNVGEKMALAKYQYIPAVRKAVGQVVDGAKRFVNSPKKTWAEIQGTWAEREAKIAALEEENAAKKRAQYEQILGKAEGGETATGAVKGGIKKAKTGGGGFGGFDTAPAMA